MKGTNMARISNLVIALTGSLTLLAATPAMAAGPGFYSVTPEAPVAASKAVVRDVLFACQGGTCTAGEGTSRPAIVCAAAAKEFGRLSAFKAGAAEFDADALAKCNAKAKVDTTQIVQR
jgi:hypothetical protein